MCPTWCRYRSSDRSAVTWYLQWPTLHRRASRNTLAAYGADLDNLQTFLARRQQKPAGADTEALRAYLKSLDYVGMTPRTVARRLSVIRQFFRFLLADGLVLREDDIVITAEIDHGTTGSFASTQVADLKGFEPQRVRWIEDSISVEACLAHKLAGAAQGRSGLGNPLCHSWRDHGIQ